MNEMIKDYRQESAFVNIGAGTSTWCRASKGGKAYFIKSFLENTLVDEESAQKLPPQMVEAKRKSCIQFRIRKDRVYNKLNEIQNNIFIVPEELFTYNGHFCTATEYLPYFKNADIVYRFGPRRRVILMRTAVAAMSVLAENHIVHSDIKPDNVLIVFGKNHIPQLKIIDFDSSFFEDAPPRNVNEYHGDMVYFAPESMIFLQSEGESEIRLTCAVDQFALGILLHQMWCGSIPLFDKNESSNVAEAVLLDLPVTLDGSLPEELRKIVVGLLQEDPESRMSYAEVYELLGRLLENMPAEKEVSLEDAVEGEAKEEVQIEKKPLADYPDAKADASVPIHIVCVDAAGNAIDGKILFAVPGSNVEIEPLMIEGYRCLDGKHTVYVDKYGREGSNAIRFRYKKKGWLFAWLLGLLAVAFALEMIFYVSASSAVSKEDWGKAYLFSSLCPFYSRLVPDGLNTIHYNYGIQLYHEGKYSDAENEFGAVPSDYERKQDYSILLKAHSFNDLEEEEQTKLISLIGFEDAKDLVLGRKSTAISFLMGTWNVSSNGSFLDDYTMGQRDDGSYYMSNIPDFPSRSAYWNINNGYLMYEYIDGDGREIKLHKIQIIHKYKVTFTNCVSGKVYTLMRKTTG
ncbi:MAG: protein kinase [Lachnospiraceae bacterium]|nr:protein kinase [Lachnospiraceae bacterium]